MRVSRVLVVLSFALAMLFSFPAHAETAKQAFERGNGLLQQGKCQEALQAYASAVRADRTNQEYAQQFLLVRRVIALRANLNKEQDARLWMNTAQSLRAFYISQRVYSEALPIDAEIHAREGTAISAGQLAETQLALGMESDAAKVLAALSPQETTTVTRALLAIALARQGQLDQAKTIGKELDDSAGSDPGTLYVLARMRTVLGEPTAALGLLTRCFELVPPSRLNDLKTHAKTNAELAGLAKSDGFAVALRTESKVAESKCSGGSSCAGCPMRANCASSQGK